MTDSWPVYGYDSGHTGHGRDVRPPERPVELAWRYHLDGKAAWQAPVVDERGNAFVHAKMTQVEAPNFLAVGGDGTLRWALKTSPGMGPGAPPPTVSDRRVVLPDTPEAWTVESHSGGRIHETALHPSGVNHAHPTVVDGRIHAGFRTFDLDSGDEVWTYESEEPVYRVLQKDGAEAIREEGPTGRAAAVVDGVVYVAGRQREGETRFVPTDDLPEKERTGLESSLATSDSTGEMRDYYEEWGHVHALDATDGALLWRMEFDTPVRDSTPTVVADGIVYVFDADRRLRAFDAADGTERWSVAFDVETVAGWRPAVADGQVFVGVDGTLVALDAIDGSETWRSSLRTEPAGPPAVADGTVYASDVHGTIYAVETNGNERWQFDLSESLRTGPVVADGRLYVAGRDLFCLRSRH